MAIQELVEDMEEGEVVSDDLWPGKEDTGTLSLQVMEGVAMGSTLKIKGLLEGQKIIILLDNSSLDPFIDLRVTEIGQTKSLEWHGAQCNCSKWVEDLQKGRISGVNVGRVELLFLLELPNRWAWKS